MADDNKGPAPGGVRRVMVAWSGDGNHGIPGLSGDGNHGIPGLSGDGNHGIPGLAGMPMAGTLDGPTDAFPMLAQARFPIVWWDPALRAQLVVAEFGAKYEIWRRLENGPDGYWPEGTAAEIGALLKRRAERLQRSAEILAQAGSFVEYWYQLLGADQGRRPATAAMIHVGIAIGHMVGMYWKAHFKRPRPAHVYPALQTVVPTPPHPAFPSNHALQNKLIHLCLAASLPKPVADALDGPMAALAFRIADNREVAGVHYPSDTLAGMGILAPRVFRVLRGESGGQTTVFDTLREAVEQEWNDWVPDEGAAPDRSGEAGPTRLPRDGDPKKEGK